MMRPCLIAVLPAAWSPPAAAQNEAFEITMIAGVLVREAIERTYKAVR